MEPAVIDDLCSFGFLEPDPTGTFRSSDIQRVRAVMAMRSPGIELEQLTEAFRRGLFTLQPMDLLYPVPEVVLDTMPAELATSLGMSEQELIRVMISAGFPAPVPGAPMRADDIRLATKMVETARKLGGPDVLGRFARTYGETARRSAESGVAMFAENVNSPIVNAKASDEERFEVNTLAAELMASSEVLLGELYRRHLEQVLLKQWADQAELFLDQIGVRPQNPHTHALAFIDLSGYTALTAQRGDTTAVRLAERLAELADDTASRHSGRVVKLLGDGAMLYFEDPAAAVIGALTLVDSIGASELPPAHAGVNAGPVIERDGDYFGHTVNLASRISGQARSGQVLVSERVASERVDGVVFSPAGSRALKGADTMPLFLAAWT